MTNPKRTLASLIIAFVTAAATMACGSGSAPDAAPLPPAVAAPTVAPPAQTAAVHQPADTPTPPVAVPVAQATKPVLPTDPPARATDTPAPVLPTETAVQPTAALTPTTDTVGPPSPPFGAITPPPLPTATETPAAPTGTQVGEVPPAFAMELADGALVTSTDLAAAGRPVLMMYFATW